MIAVPFMEIFDNPQQFGPLIASIPHLLSRYDLIPAAGTQRVAEEEGDSVEGLKTTAVVAEDTETQETTGIDAAELKLD